MGNEEKGLVDAVSRCPSLPALVDFATNPERLKSPKVDEISNHVDVCQFCAKQVVIAQRRVLRVEVTDARLRRRERDIVEAQVSPEVQLPGQSRSAYYATASCIIAIELQRSDEGLLELALISGHEEPAYEPEVSWKSGAETRQVEPVDVAQDAGRIRTRYWFQVDPVMASESQLPSETSQDSVSKRIILLAASILLCVLGLTAVARAWSLSREITALRQKNVDLHQKLSDTFEKLEKAKIVESIEKSPSYSFRQEFDEGLKFGVEFDSSNPRRLILRLNENVKLPYYKALRVQWDADRPETNQFVYYWQNNTQLPQLVTYDFDPLPPNHPPMERSVAVRFFATKHAQEKLGVSDTIEKTISLLQTSRGLVLIPGSEKEDTSVTIVSPPDHYEVDNEFSVKLRIHTSKDRDSAPSMLHVLVRPRNGAIKWREQYYVLPSRFSTSELKSRGRAHEIDVPVSLQSLLNPSVAVDNVKDLPTEFEILVVELPFRLTGWSLPSELLNLADRKIRDQLVKDDVVVEVKQKALIAKGE